MTEYSKYNLIYRLQKWMDSVPGQTFLNYAYSWGASIVILGTLFKLTHLPGANIMLFCGMGTEVLVFFISAFDRPFDKTADGRELPTRVTEEYLETGRVEYAHEPSVPSASSVAIHDEKASRGSNLAIATAPETSRTEMQQHFGQAEWVGQQQEPSAELMEAQSNYIEELKKLTETLGKVSEQSVRLTRDSEEMENLNRTLTGISKVYEMQLKGASQQIGTIDQINEQSRRMAQQIEQLNKIYTRMIEAMTVNMKATTGGVSE